jgi:hypothetical protein
VIILQRNICQIDSSNGKFSSVAICRQKPHLSIRKLSFV